MHTHPVHPHSRPHELVVVGGAVVEGDGAAVELDGRGWAVHPCGALGKGAGALDYRLGVLIPASITMLDSNWVLAAA